MISPALAQANNGNWHTARRWADFLAADYRVEINDRWRDNNAEKPDALIALHARRSAASLAAFHQAFPERPTVLVMTGTDIYRDIRHDAQAKQSMAMATRLVVLQEAALEELDAANREKAVVIHQSALIPQSLSSPDDMPPAGRDGTLFRCIMIGHLRAEKDPATFLAAIGQLSSPQYRFVHVGGLLEARFEAPVRALADADPRYRWLGNLPQQDAWAQLRASDVMVIASLMEGGANVIIEALACGVPVLASDISGNRGMLGADYAGYFPVGDSGVLATLIKRAARDPAFLSTLRGQCTQRLPLFAPAREQAAVRQLMDNLVQHRR